MYDMIRKDRWTALSLPHAMPCHAKERMNGDLKNGVLLPIRGKTTHLFCFLSLFVCIFRSVSCVRWDRGEGGGEGREGL